MADGGGIYKHPLTTRGDSEAGKAIAAFCEKHNLMTRQDSTFWDNLEAGALPVSYDWLGRVVNEAQRKGLTSDPVFGWLKKLSDGKEPGRPPTEPIPQPGVDDPATSANVPAAEAKQAEAKQAEAKQAEAKQAEAKQAEAKQAEAEQAEAAKAREAEATGFRDGDLWPGGRCSFVRQSDKSWWPR